MVLTVAFFWVLRALGFYKNQCMMWRAWCSEARLNWCGAPVQARSTATHTVVVPGYDPHRPEWPLPSAHSVPSGQSPHRASRAAWSHVWNGLKGPCVGTERAQTLESEKFELWNLLIVCWFCNFGQIIQVLKVLISLLITEDSTI